MKDDKQKTLLTLPEACRIIKVCGESGVTVLKFGDLYVKFGQKASPTPDKQVLSPKAAAEIAETQLKEAERAHLVDEIAVKEQRLAEAIILDPSLAEEMFMQGELSIDGGSGEEEA